MYGYYYPIYHPFHVMMYEGKLTKEQLQSWVLNRFYYQISIPLKDAAILSNCPNQEIRKEKHEKAKVDYTTKIDEINKNIDECNNELKDKDQTDDKLKQLLKLETKIEHNIENNNNNLSFFSENTNCPTCTQEIDEDFRYKKQGELKQKVAGLEEGMQKLSSEISKVEERVSHFGKIT